MDDPAFDERGRVLPPPTPPRIRALRTALHGLTVSSTWPQRGYYCQREPDLSYCVVATNGRRLWIARGFEAPPLPEWEVCDCDQDGFLTGLTSGRGHPAWATVFVDATTPAMLLGIQTLRALRNGIARATKPDLLAACAFLAAQGEREAEAFVGHRTAALVGTRALGAAVFTAPA